MGFIYYNPNPKGKDTGDCVIRALTLLFDKTWYEIYHDLCNKGYDICELPSSNNLWGQYLQEKGFKRFPLPDYCPICYTVADFCRENPTGEFLLALNEHVVYVLNGNYYDSWDSGNMSMGYPQDMRVMDRSWDGRMNSMANYENNRSNHSISDRMIASLEQQMNMAQTDYERQQILAEIKHIRENQNK